MDSIKRTYLRRRLLNIWTFLKQLLSKHFTSVARELVEKLPCWAEQYGERHVFQYYSQQGVQVDGFSFTQVSTAVVLEVLNCYKAKEIQWKSLCVIHIVNLSIEQGLIPCKLARVIPLYNNNRTMSILCTQLKRLFLIKLCHF